MKPYVALTVLVALALGKVLGGPQASFDEGLRLYRAGDMEGAIRAWESVMRQGAVSGALLYNLGNAYYRTGNIGRAILYFERARKLLPRDGDVKMNLELARLAVVDKIEPPVRLVIWDWVDAVRDRFSSRELASGFHVLGLLAVISILFWRFSPQQVRRGLRAAAITLLVLWVLCGAWYGWRAAEESKPYGVIMAAKADVYSAPDENAKQLFSLHEGSKVVCGETLTGWVRIGIADGRKGWVRASCVERI